LVDRVFAPVLVAYDVRGIGLRLMRSLQLGSIAAFTLAVIALALGESVASTAMFTVAAVGFLVVLVLQRRR
jgi:O-antigen ligase